MAHWFHRNPLKATSVANFELKLINAETQAIQLCSELRSARTELLNLLPDTSNPGSTVEAALRKYLELLMGFIETPREDANVGDKLRWSLRFRWTHSVLGGTPEAQNDVMFEAVSVILNVAIWFMKNAARLASNETISMDEAKFVHSGLRKAAGLFTFVETRLLRQLPHNPVPGGDLDPRVLTAYLNQCTAEAQEVTIARAIELKHKPSLVSALAHETHQLFTKAAVGLATLDQNVFGQWLTYLKLKALIYHAMAYCYTGENLLSEDKCGLAVRSLQESKKKIVEATELCKTYSKAKGPGSSTVAKPAQHAFFRKLTATITRIAEKCERENGLIYHEKVPFDPPTLELKATYGLVAPEEFQVPPVSPMWTPFVYRAVDVSKIFDNAMNKKSEGNIDPVKEVPIAANGKDPENESGCVIS